MNNSTTHSSCSTFSNQSPATPTERTSLLQTQGSRKPTSLLSRIWRQGGGKPRLAASDRSCREHSFEENADVPVHALQDARPEENARQRQTWSSMHDYFSLTLENSGSVARDHLASERTFLAYMRTSLAIASAGVALVQLFSAGSVSGGGSHRLNTYIRPLGASAVAIGICTLFIGFIRYFSVQAALTKGSFPVARLATGLIATLLAALVSLTFGVLLAGKLEVKRR